MINLHTYQAIVFWFTRAYNVRFLIIALKRRTSGKSDILLEKPSKKSISLEIQSLLKYQIFLSSIF